MNKYRTDTQSYSIDIAKDKSSVYTFARVRVGTNIGSFMHSMSSLSLTLITAGTIGTDGQYSGSCALSSGADCPCNISTLACDGLSWLVGDPRGAGLTEDFCCTYKIYRD